MKSKIFLAVMVLSPLANVASQTLAPPTLRAQKPAAEVQNPKPTVLKIHACGEPDPALRFRFWPAPANRRNENPIPFVSRAILLSLKAMNDPASRKEFSDRYSEWSEMPIDKLPRDEVRTFIQRFGGTPLSELARAENLLRIDYDLQWDKLSTAEIVGTLLPELQEMRHLARLLQLRIRLAVAEQRWDDAIRDIRVGFRLAEIAGHSTDFLIGRLVGFAVSGVMMQATLEAIEQPDCPNLYWALASLPEHRLFETRDSLEFESVLVSRLLTTSPPLPDHPIGAAAARDRIRKIAEQGRMSVAYSMKVGSSDFSVRMMTGLYVVGMAESSRELLATSTDWGDRAKELSAPEAVLRAVRLNFMRARDEWVKWSLLPPEVWSEYEVERSAVFEKQQSQRDVMAGLVYALAPAVDAARLAGRRTLQTRNLLLSIEAIRMHAAVTGELPKTLNKLRPVPCWNDGISLTPFGYQRSSESTAMLTRQERWPGDPETTFQLELIQGDE